MPLSQNTTPPIRQGNQEIPRLVKLRFPCRHRPRVLPQGLRPKVREGRTGAFVTRGQLLLARRTPLLTALATLGSVGDIAPPRIPLLLPRPTRPLHSAGTICQTRKSFSRLRFQKNTGAVFRRNMTRFPLSLATEFGNRMTWVCRILVAFDAAALILRRLLKLQLISFPLTGDPPSYNATVRERSGSASPHRTSIRR